MKERRCELSASIVDRLLYENRGDKLDLFDVRPIHNKRSIVLRREDANKFQASIVHHLGFAKEGKRRRRHSEFLGNPPTCRSLVALRGEEIRRH